jgi:hypothetical protein
LYSQKLSALPAAGGEAEGPYTASAVRTNTASNQLFFLFLHDKGSSPSNKYQVMLHHKSSYSVFKEAMGWETVTFFQVGCSLLYCLPSFDIASFMQHQFLLAERYSKSLPKI